MVGNLTKKKSQMPGSQPVGGGIGTLGFDSYISFYYRRIPVISPGLIQFRKGFRVGL